MSNNVPGSVAPFTTKSIPKFAKFVFFGGAAGLLLGVVVLFLVSLTFGEAIGLAPGACVAFGCFATLLLSQAVGLAGMIVGAAAGAVAGGVVYYVHHHVRRPS
jgi:hypothetical protein